VDTWDLARNALKDGNIDVLPMMAYSKERDQQFDFSVPHTIAYDAFFTRKDAGKIRSLDDLQGKKIIVMKDDQAHDYLRSTGLVGPEQLILIDSLPDALRLLSSGKGDAALMPKLVGLIIVKNLKLSNLELSPIVIDAYKRPFSFAVVEGNRSLLERLSQGLSIVKASDQYSNIYKKWFGALEPSGLSLRTILKYIGGMILAFTMIGSVLLLWSFSLRRQVALRTRALEEEIVERKHAEEELLESEKKYRDIFDNAQVGIFRTRISDGKVLECNDRFARTYGYQTPEACMADFVASEHYTDPGTREKMVDSLMEDGKVNNFEACYSRKDGGDVWVRFSAQAYPEQGYLEGVGYEITEEKRVLEALRESQEKYRAVLD